MGEQRPPSLKRVRLAGARFDRGRLPIASLMELQNYQEAIRIAAEAEWRRDHPDEQLPADFQDSTSLAIERIDEGSADVFLAFEQPGYVPYQVGAQELIDGCIVAAYSGEPFSGLSSLLPEDSRQVREKVSLIGETLGGGQSIEYYPSGFGSAPVVITAEARAHAVERLVPVSHDAERRNSPLSASRESLVGRVTALDASRKKFTLIAADDTEIHGWYRKRPEILEDLREVVNSTEEGPLTRITGDLQVKDGRPFRFWEIDCVERLEFDDTHWGHRLAAFAAMPSGWDGGEAAQISSTALDAAQRLLREIDGARMERPGVFPTDEGGVLVEWAGCDGVQSVEILDDGSFEMFSLRRGQQEGRCEETADLRRAVAFAVAEGA